VNGRSTSFLLVVFDGARSAELEGRRQEKDSRAEREKGEKGIGVLGQRWLRRNIPSDSLCENRRNKGRWSWLYATGFRPKKKGRINKGEGGGGGGETENSQRRRPTSSLFRIHLNLSLRVTLSR